MDTGVLGKPRDAIFNGVLEERPTTVSQFPDEASVKYFFDCIVTLRKQKFYGRFEELKDGIKEAEERSFNVKKEEKKSIGFGC